MEDRDWNVEIPYDISFQILKRLPAKSLMRFKCVCRTWRALIEDRIFAEHHRFQSENRRDASYMLLVVDEDGTRKESIIPVNYSGVCTTDIAGLKLGEYKLCTDVVEGLACIRDKSGTLCALNVTTGEKLRLPPEVKVRYGCFTSYLPRYFLGFDPLDKNYKLVSIRLGEKSAGCEILTLGENSWREIDPPSDEPVNAKFTMTQKGVSVNGAIYWIHGRSGIRYFDVHVEKFMQLDLPHGVGWIFQWARVGDSLGLLCKGTAAWLVLWTLSPTKVWKMQEMHHVWDSIFRSRIDGYEIIVSTKTGELLWMPDTYGYMETLDDPTSMVQRISFTSYDPTSKLQGQMSIDITHPWVGSSGLWPNGATGDHVENILPLKTLSSRDRKD